MNIHTESTATVSMHWGSDIDIARIARCLEPWKADRDISTDHKLLRYLGKHKHTSPFEFAGATFFIHTPLFVARQVFRHRTFSYNELSGRYKEIPDDAYVPMELHPQHAKNKQMSDITQTLPENTRIGIAEFARSAHRNYQRLLHAGVSREEARMILPQNMMTQFYMTGNLHAYSHFLRLRLAGDAQPATRQLAECMHAALLPLFPVALPAILG